MLLRRLLVTLLFGAPGFTTNTRATDRSRALALRADQSPAVALTNAKRFASDFLLSLHVVVALTLRQVAPHSGSSPIPSITYTCLIGVRQIDANQIIGYLTPATSGTAVKLQASAVNAVVATFKIPLGVTSQNGMLVYDTSTGLVLAGLTSLHVNQAMYGTSPNYVTLSSVDPPSDTPPTYEKGYFQSSIWSSRYNIGSQILTTKWVNPNGAAIDLNVDVYIYSFIRLTGKALGEAGLRRGRFECVGF
ncbi:hypothetical protein R3P38DRAFT_3169591 [Favolaschia claudopus]|uniref:Uncharacterized protein n=1 Tax=Favolaschia claudopus TaxID=2862362 RepID=A0AAW0DZH9_9AGAR